MTMNGRGRDRPLMAHLATAFLLGAVSGLAGNVQSRRESAELLVDWGRVRQLAGLVSRRLPQENLSPGRRAQLEADYRRIIDDVSPRMLAYLGSGSALQFRFEAWAHVVDRQTWIDANVDNFRVMFEPVESMVRDRLSGRLSTPINQQISSVFLGVLLGYLSGRVLGQYDPSLLGKEAITAGRLFFVEPNLEGARRELAIPRDQFLTWIVFHELTHSWQFEAHPWLREFMNRQVRRLMLTSTGRLMETDAGALLRLALRGDLSLRNPQRMVSAVMTGEQRHIFDRLQAVMCLLEGFSNHVMDALGPEMLADYEQISHKFEARQGQRSPGERLFARVTGLEIKMEQYRVGEAFVQAIVRRRGIEFMNQAWESELKLPLLAEIYQPSLWIERMEALAAPASAP